MVFVVAEIGVNWDGNLDLVKQMMFYAKNVGCNAVKFQAFNEDIIKTHPQHKRLIKNSINKNNIEEINSLSKSVGIEWFCTPMYPNAVEMLKPYVKRFKIRMIDGRSLLENKTTELIENILKTEKQTIISSQISPIKSRFFSHPNIKWLYVVSKYPCKLSDLDFRKLVDFDGYSNHCPFIIAPLSAVVLGKEMVEVHITSDKNKDFIDNKISFDYDELKILMDLIQQYQKIKV